VLLFRQSHEEKEKDENRDEVKVTINYEKGKGPKEVKRWLLCMNDCALGGTYATEREERQPENGH
jgi:hypothetical protein